MTYADRLGRSDSAAQVRKALAIAPDNVNYWLHWVDLKRADGESAGVGLTRAAEVDPYNATVWIRAGLDEEMNGHYARAEQLLLRAAQRSRQFEPRWILASYYFRRNDEEHFWPWINSALTWATGDRTLLFELCWEMRADANTILSRGIPDEPKPLRDYLGYLLHYDRWEAAVMVARKLEKQATGEDHDLLLRYIERMLDQQRWDAALSAWNTLCLRKVVAFSPINPQTRHFLTNGDFAAEPLGSGFDWHLPRVDGVESVRNDSPAWLRFDFSGEQPEDCSPLYELVPAAPGRYKLRFGYRTEGIAPQTGLQWRVVDELSRKPLPSHPLSLSSEQWSEGQLDFQIPAGVRMARIELTYHRPPGTVRIEGAAWLRHVGLEGEQ